MQLTRLRAESTDIHRPLCCSCAYFVPHSWERPFSGLICYQQAPMWRCQMWKLVPFCQGRNCRQSPSNDCQQDCPPTKSLVRMVPLGKGSLWWEIISPPVVASQRHIVLGGWLYRSPPLCVRCSVLLNRYWGIVMGQGFHHERAKVQGGQIYDPR